MLFHLCSEKVFFCVFAKFRNMELSRLLGLRGQDNKFGFPKMSYEGTSSLASFKIILFYFFNLIFILYWSRVDLHCCVGFRCAAK